MPAPTAYTPSQPPTYPALYLYPLNDSFIPKQISLVGGQRVKVGRQTNQKTAPAERNGYFDSKVLSRQHAEVWEDNGHIYIKDVKSSNGTFINGERLSAEGVESEQFELKTDDIVEFGIDIVGEDNKTIIHHKVAARIACVFTAEDALSASREAHNYQQQQQQQAAHQPPSSGGINASTQRRPTLQAQTGISSGMGGLGAGVRQQGGRSGLTFEHILSRLQGELAKSRETGAELGAVSTAMGEIGDVMTGGQPPNLPPYPQSLPPVRPPPSTSPQQQEREVPMPLLQSLQAQVSENQAKTDLVIEKMSAFESQFNVQSIQGLTEQVAALHDLIQGQDRRSQHHTSEGHHMSEVDDDDDARSIHTITSHELESVPEEDETEAEESEEERSARREELGRPRTPEPSSLGMRDYDEHEHDRGKGDRDGSMEPSHPPGLTDELAQRLTFLADQLESCLEISQNLRSQNVLAHKTIESLEAKVKALEDLVISSHAAELAKMQEYAKNSEMQNLLANSREEEEKRMERLTASFHKELDERMEKQKAFAEEMDRESNARSQQLEKIVTAAVQKFDTGLSSLAIQLANSAKSSGAVSVNVKRARRHTGGLVTPPSPSSLSDSELYNTDVYELHGGFEGKQGNKRGDSSRSSSRSRTGRRRSSRSRSPATSTTSATLVDSASASVDGSSKPKLFDAHAHSRSSSSDEGSFGESSHRSGSISASPEKMKFQARFPPTPADSLMLGHIPGGRREAAKAKSDDKQVQVVQVSNTQVAVGVFVLGVAAAAVLWRVKD